MNIEKLRAFAPDLNRVAPRSPSAAPDEFPVWADWSTNAVQSSSGRPAPIASTARWTGDFLRRLDCRCCETWLPRAPTITRWPGGWQHKRKRPQRSSFAGVGDFRRIRSGGSSKWKIGCTGAVGPESTVRNSLRSAHSPIRTRSNQRYRMVSGFGYTTALDTFLHGAGQNVFGVSAPRETRNANRSSSCGASNAWLKWSFRSIYDPGRTYYEM